MRKVLISLTAAAAALAVASPAAAQYYPQSPAYGGNGYNGYANNNYGQVRALQARIDSLQWRISQARRFNGGERMERLREESRRIEQRLHQAGRNGLNPYEANDIQARIARLENQVQYASANRYGRYGNGYNGHGYGDRGDDHRWGDRDDDRDGHHGYGDRDDD